MRLKSYTERIAAIRKTFTLRDCMEKWAGLDGK
jgi:hypothetical protein